MILALKHGDRTDMVPTLARWLARTGRELLADVDMIAPVALHWTRLWNRRFNQSALLARALSQQTETLFAPDVLVRKRRTPSQGGFGAAGRHRNVRGAFRIQDRWRQRLAGRRVLLIDDVMTTGATVSACARALRKGGASHVHVLTLARVARPAPSG
jgi:ComF family protein